MKENQTFTAIIPVRKGSRRMKDKNLAPFGDSNLLTHKIRQLKQVEAIDTIVVSSDSERMLEMAEEEGVETHVRSWEYCDEKTKTFGEVVENICSDVEGDHTIWATCTSPLVLSDLFTEAIELYLKKLAEGYDSLLTVEGFQKYVLSEKGPLNYQHGKKHVPSQQLEKWYFKSNGIMISPRLKMVEWQYLYGPNSYLFEIDKVFCVDVDDELDLAQAEAWYNIYKQQSTEAAG